MLDRVRDFLGDHFGLGPDARDRAAMAEAAKRAPPRLPPAPSLKLDETLSKLVHEYGYQGYHGSPIGHVNIGARIGVLYAIDLARKRGHHELADALERGDSA